MNYDFRGEIANTIRTRVETTVAAYRQLDNGARDSNPDKDKLTLADDSYQIDVLISSDLKFSERRIEGRAKQYSEYAVEIDNEAGLEVSDPKGRLPQASSLYESTDDRFYYYGLSTAESFVKLDELEARFAEFDEAKPPSD